MRFVVVGLGKVGRALAAQLTAEKHDIVVVDQNPALTDNFVNIYDVDINDRQSRWRGST